MYKDNAHLNPVEGCHSQLDDVVHMTPHVERSAEAGGAREDAEVPEGLRQYFVRNIRDRKQADGQPGCLRCRSAVSS